MDKAIWTPFVKNFDASNSNWRDTREENFAFIWSCEYLAKDLMEKNGRVSLNEIYRLLGFEEIEGGDTLGWLKGGAFSFEVFIENDGHDFWVDFVEF
jgi:hypothetical protein